MISIFFASEVKFLEMSGKTKRQERVSAIF